MSEYRYIMHDSRNWTAVTTDTVARWAQESRAADLTRNGPPSAAAKAHAKLEAKRRRGRVARARRKAQERAEGARIRANRPQIGARIEV